MSRELHSERRYKVLKPESFVVGLQRASSKGVTKTTLCNVSCSEATLLVPVQLQPFEEVQLYLTHSEAGLDIVNPALVRWADLGRDGYWSVGCSFQQRLAHELLISLVESGDLDRRAYPRRPFHMPVRVQWDYDPATCPGFLWNLSSGGFCVVCPRKPGRKVLITSEGSEAIVNAKVCWQAKTGGGYVVGCEFLQRHSFQEVLDWKTPFATPEAGVERRLDERKGFRGLVSRVLSGARITPIERVAAPIEPSTADECPAS